MKSNFSETQFQFAILHEMVNKSLPFDIFLPNTISETKLGYDAKIINSKGIPVFYQFKISEYLFNNGKESVDMGGSYFRFHTYKIKNNKLNQHNLLCELNKVFRNVFYVAPCFYKIEDFQKFFKCGNINGHSKFIRFNKLFEITDGEAHSICYTKDKSIVKMFSDVAIDAEGCLSFQDTIAELLQAKVIPFEIVAQNIREIVSDSLTNDFQCVCSQNISNVLKKYGIDFLWFVPKKDN